MTTGTLLLTTALMLLGTVACRFLPFLLGGRLGSPAWRQVFVELFPPAVLAVLIVYLGGGSADAARSVQLAQAAGALTTVAAHLLFRSLLLSVGSGTLVCMGVQAFWPG